MKLRNTIMISCNESSLFTAHTTTENILVLPSL